MLLTAVVNKQFALKTTRSTTRIGINCFLFSSSCFPNILVAKGGEGVMRM